MQALGYEGAVEALQARDVGDGAERDEVEQVEDLGLGQRFEHAAAPHFPQQRNPEQKGHADRREMAVRRPVRILVEPVGIDQRVRRRKLARALVMIDDDHVEPGDPCFVERVERLRATIDANGDVAPRAFSSTSALPDGP